VDLSLANLSALDRGAAEDAIRSRVQTLYLGDGVMLARILGRHKIFLHTSDRGLACHLAMDGYWEIWVTQFVARLLQPGMTAIDVGANYGYYTLLFGDAVGAQGRVVAVEPNPRAAALLRETLHLNGHAGITTLVEAAVGAPDAPSAHLFVPDGEPKNAALTGHEALPGGETVTVPVLSVDSLVAGFDRVDLVKIDAEGSEVDIIAGMRETIARHRPAIILEFNAARYADARGFLLGLIDAYGTPIDVGFDGIARPVGVDTVLTARPGQDWTLYFAAAPRTSSPD